jgi:hypothetical protein
LYPWGAVLQKETGITGIEPEIISCSNNGVIMGFLTYTLVCFLVFADTSRYGDFCRKKIVEKKSYTEI